MKKVLSLLAMLIAVQFSYAQWTTSGTNTTTTDNVGIGTSTPTSTMEILSGTTNVASGLILNQGNGSGNANSARLFFSNTGDISTNSFAIFKNTNTLSFSYGANAGTSSGTRGFVMTNAGNVGIGTASPATRLDVSGATTTTPTIINRNTSYSSTDATGTVALGLYFANHGAAKIEASKSATNITDLNFYGEYGFNTPSPIMTLRPTSLTGGNVGIGTTDPTNNLQIGSIGSSGYGGNAIAAGDGTNVIAMHYGTTGYLIANGNLALGGGTNTSSQLFLESGGNVGIGTTDPKGYKLAVNGSMIATSIKVKPYANWPDYVFKPEYKLPSLSEVKTYIDQNQHLPNMPSETEVAKDGIDLGEIVNLQMKKIEELTLYLIEQNKKIEIQTKQLIRQQRDINELRKQAKVNQ